jgi:hypothetical protein
LVDEQLVENYSLPFDPSSPSMPNFSMLFDNISKLLRVRYTGEEDKYEVAIESLDKKQCYEAIFNKCEFRTCDFSSPANRLFLGSGFIGGKSKSILVNADDGTIDGYFEDYAIGNRFNISPSGDLLMLKKHRSEHPGHVWRLFPFSPNKTPLPEMMAYLVLQNNRRKKEKLCEASVNILKQSRQCVLQEFVAQLPADPSTAQLPRAENRPV